MLQSLNAKRFTPALVNIGGGVQQYLPEYRDSFRIVQDSPSIADWLLEALRPHLPQGMVGPRSPWRVPVKNLELSEINERCRFLCYVPGQHFRRHADGGEMRRARASSSSSARDLSLVTLQLYLHDMPHQNGGATRFHCAGGQHIDYHPTAG